MKDRSQAMNSLRFIPIVLSALHGCQQRVGSTGISDLQSQEDVFFQ